MATQYQTVCPESGWSCAELWMLKLDYKVPSEIDLTPQGSALYKL